MTSIPRPAPAGAPNVLVILFDDLGYAQLGCYGSDIETPHLDRLADGGLRYDRFHVTAICSPSRAALLTGRNHHRVGFGFLVDLPFTHPGYHCHRPDGAGTLPEVLVDAGWAAVAVGKWHLTPQGERSDAGPFGTWPLGWGFERFYGFLQGDANHWRPLLVQDNHYLPQPAHWPEGYHLTEDLADRLIRYLTDLRHAAPDKPFFAYLSLGAMHAPHHVPPEWIERYRGRFDDGWEAVRARAFARQRELGVVPPDTRLPERPPWIPEWSSLSADERRVCARMQETFAGFLTHTDAQIGRVLDHLAATGQLDNTLVLVLSDNGASAEGGVSGTSNEMRFTHHLTETTERHLELLDHWGGPRTYPHYAWGWAWAGNTPFRLWKRYTWLGGTRSPLIVHWPRQIRSGGEVRHQLAHIIDLMPTVLDACGVPAPSVLSGVSQLPLDGASLLATFTDADAPSPRTTQYFEMLGSRSILHGRWKATTDHVSEGVADEERLLVGSRDFASDRWCLYDLEADFAESTDVSERYPELVAELAAVWQAEAERNLVLPIKDSLVPKPDSGFSFDDLLPRPYPIVTPLTYRPGASPIVDDCLPRLLLGGTVSAVIDAPAGSTPAEGVICALGDWHGGFAVYLIDGRPRAVLNAAGDAAIAAAPEALTPGRHEVIAHFTPAGQASEVRLDVDGVTVAVSANPNPIPFAFQHGGCALHLGEDRGFPVCDEYEPPFAFTGTVHSVTIDAALHRPAVPAPDPAPRGRDRWEQALRAD